MDPIANLKEQLRLAERLQFFGIRTNEEKDDAARLAALVIALAEWRANGGFDPYPRVDVAKELKS